MGDIDTSKVYIMVNENGKVIALEGGYTTPRDLSGWTFIDEGYGDKYNLAQSHYLELPLIDADGCHNYVYEDGIRLATEEEKADEMMEQIVVPTRLDELEAQIMYTALMTDTLLEED